MSHLLDPRAKVASARNLLTRWQCVQRVDGDVAVTRASYIKRVGQKSIDAMDRLEAEIARPAKKSPKGTKKASTRIA